MANLFDVYNDGFSIDHAEGETLETGETPITISGLTADTTYDKVQVSYTGSYNKLDVPSFKTNSGRNLLTKTDYFITEEGDGVKHSLTVEMADLVGRTVTISFKADIDEVTSVSGNARFIMAFTTYDSDGNSTYNPAIKSMKVGDSYHGVIQRTLIVPNDGVDYYIALSIQGVSGKNMKIGRPKLEAGNMATDWIPAPEDSAT